MKMTYSVDGGITWLEASLAEYADLVGDMIQSSVPAIVKAAI